ncbi:MAG: chlorophyllide reductase subunit Z, partial [Chloroflexus aggregans]
GAANIMQELVNRFYETVINFLPVETVTPTAGGPPQPTSAETIPWTKEATDRLNAALDAVPYLARISASRSLRAAAEQAARARGLKEVTLEIVEAAIAQGTTS